MEFSNVEWQLPQFPSGSIMVCHSVIDMLLIYLHLYKCKSFGNDPYIFPTFNISDSIYTERYMNQPSENLEFYNVS